MSYARRAIHSGVDHRIMRVPAAYAKSAHYTIHSVQIVEAKPETFSGCAKLRLCQRAGLCELARGPGHQSQDDPADRTEAAAWDGTRSAGHAGDYRNRPQPDLPACPRAWGLWLYARATASRPAGA